ncbi:hypothetical protein IMSHALPRED_004802 [Imshaugia aleurites]|uniref:Uncharacterized protein n=1 Tax=Imshaugia aleurites TaxID=172621 RepID=A0A8H3I9M7_9LECA|nr:hypothetical protein IMSHALPRED_004802 [Imshaugia aleurites]
MSPCTCTSLNGNSNGDNCDWDHFPPAVKRKVPIPLRWSKNLFPIGERRGIPPIYMANWTLCQQYFSSLERLRLAQNSSSAKRPASVKSCHATLKSPNPKPAPSRPALARRNSSYFKNSHILRKKIPSPTSDTFLPSDAQWFLSLPHKVQRKHFTREERLALSGQRESVLFHPSHERSYNFYRQGGEGNRSVPTLRTSSYSSLSSLSTFDDGQAQPADSAVDMDDSMIWFDDDNDLDLSSKLQLDDYHEFMTKAADSDVKPSKRQPSFRRALSLNQLPFGADTVAIPPLPKATHSRPPAAVAPRPFLAPAREAQTSNSAIEASAKYYQDPEARLKLRVYLASPQNFDEAIEFGFPSMEDTEDRPLSRPSLSRAPKTTPCKTFLHDDISSLFDALDDNDDAESTTSLPERDAPYTPTHGVFNHDAMLLSPSVATSAGSTSTLFPKPTVRHHNASEPFAQLLAGSREMTLRMTLTRPDLRADEKALYANTTGDDPLALEHLPPAKKEAEIWDQLPKERGTLKKLWRRVSGRS